MAPGLLLAAVLSSARAAEWRALPAAFQLESSAFGPASPAAEVPPVGREVEVPPPQMPRFPATPEQIVELGPLLNASWRGAVAFRAGGQTVHVSGMKSSNGKHGWFLSLCADPCVSPNFYKGFDLLHYKPFLSPVAVFDGSQTVEYGGRRYKVSIDGQLIHKEESRLRVEPLDKSEAKREWKVKEIADAVYAGGHPLTLNGRAYRLLYLQEILENEKGEYAGLSQGRAIVFMTLRKGKYEAIAIQTKDIPFERVAPFVRAASDADEKQLDQVPAERLLRVGLRLDGERLEVYDMAPRG